MKLKPVCGIIVEPVVQPANQFTLQTNKGVVTFTMKSPFPIMRDGDQVCVVIDGDVILHVSNLSLGLEANYSPCPPYKDETTPAKWSMELVGLLPILNIVCWQMGVHRVATWAVLLVAACSMVIPVVILTYRERSDRFNAELRAKIRKMVDQSLMNLSLWDTPTKEEHV